MYLDTHVAAWLYAGRTDLLSAKAHDLLNRETLLVSPMAALELQYLFEIGKTTEPAARVLESLRADLGVEVCRCGFAEVAEAALALDWTRDPFDRLIVANAACREARLLTRDRTIHAHYPEAVWDE